jgi:hypothetical protein
MLKTKLILTRFESDSQIETGSAPFRLPLRETGFNHELSTRR